jgi:hypothetical protein
LIVWREGEPEPVQKRAQGLIRVYRIHMNTNGTPLTTEEVSALELRLIEREREQRAREAEEAAAARASESARPSRCS